MAKTNWLNKIEPKWIKTFDTWLQKYVWWQIALCVVGVISVISVLLILFLPVGNGPITFVRIGEMPGVSSPRFKAMLGQTLNLPVEKGDRILILNNGDEFLPAVLKDIDSAKRSINFMVYIWKDGRMSDEVLAHLSQKVKQGITVRVMLDDFGSNGYPRKKFKAFKELGGRVETFHALTLLPWNLGNNHARNHRRAIVIDGKIGYTGGIAVKDYWLGHGQDEDHWRDMMFRTTGPMAAHIQGSFSELWTSTSGELLVGDAFFPQQVLPAGTLTYIPLSSTPSANSLQLQRFINLSLMAAEKKIYITTPYFLPDRWMIETLIKKARSGVDVKVLVPNNLSDASAVRQASHFSYQELLQAGVKIFEYQTTFLHAKSIEVDGIWSIIGSANMDNRSRKINEEGVYGVSDTDFTGRLDSVFKQDLTHARQITLPEWEKRSYFDRAREIFARKFVQQY